MRAEVREIYKQIAAIKAAAAECACGASELVNRLERQGHFATCEADEDWNIVETFVEACANAPHFTNRFSDDVEPYKLFVTEARVAFRGAFASAIDRRAASDAEDDLYEKLHWERLGPEAQADERAVARAS